MTTQTFRRWTYSLRSLLALVLLAAVPLGIYVDRLHRQRVRQRLAQPIIDAAERGDTKLVQSLLDQGADVDSIVNGRFPWTPLMHAAFRGHKSTVRVLLDRGGKIDHECLDGFTALTLAAAEEHWGVVELLADRGGDVHHQDATGQSALSLAEQAGQTVLFEHLRKPPSKSGQ